MKVRAFTAFLIAALAFGLSLGARAGYEFSVTSINVTEGGRSAVTLAVTRTAPLTGAGSVTWTTANGTAIAGTDFGTAGNPAQKTGTLTWTAGAGGVKSITIPGLIPIIDSPAIEESKSFTVGLSAGVNGEIGPNSQATVTILDADSIISFEGATATVNENGPNTTLTLTRSGSTSLAQAVTFKTTVGTASASDFTAVTAGSVTFAIGETTKTIAIGPTVVPAPSIRIIDDALVEGPEMFTVTLSAPTNGATLGAVPAMTITIASNENGVSMSIDKRSFAEGLGTQEIFVTRSGSAGAVDVNYAFSGGTAVNGTHYQGENGSLHWDSGEGGAKSILVNILDNEAVNAARTFNVVLSGATGATLVAPMQTAVTITDNDNTVQFSTPTFTVVEGTANAILTVTRLGGTGGTASVTWTAADGSAIAGTDFGILGNTTPPSGVLNWGANDAASKPVSIPIINDTVLEGAKTFTVSLSSPTGTGLSIGANPTSTVMLNDNEKGLAFVVPVGGYQVTEGTSSITLTVQRIGPSSGTASATYATSNVTATSGQDYVAKSGTVSWASGDMANKSIVISITNDTLGGEGDETFNVTLTPGAGYQIAAPATVPVTIHDNDLAPESNLQFSEPKYIVTEDGLTAVLTVNRVALAGGGFARATQVNYATVAGTALATSDYTTKSGLLNWAANDSDPKTISINIVNNAVAESHEAFTVTLTNPSPGTGLGTPSVASVLILDDDEVFPKHGFMGEEFYVPIEVDRGWHVSNDPTPIEGAFALKSDEIDDGESAGIAILGNFATAGTVSFRVKVSTELDFDKLTFYIDDVAQTPTWSGTANATFQLSPSFAISAGVHHLKWIYRKDDSVSVGSDAVYIDQLVANYSLLP